MSRLIVPFLINCIFCSGMNFFWDLGVGISDFSADSLALAVEAAKTNADIIVMCGVHFMAETAKLMSPNKKVLLPDMSAGCSLSSSITGEDVKKLKKQQKLYIRRFQKQCQR